VPSQQFLIAAPLCGKEFDVIIIGAGAAGLMCAVQAGRRGRRVLLVDHCRSPAGKILASGGGRCNFTNLNTTAENFHSANPHFCRSALSRFTPDDFVAMVRAHRIAYHEKKLGQLFCNQSAGNIVDMLGKECRAAAVQFAGSCRVEAVGLEAERFKIKTDHGLLEAESLVVATGGLSFPQLGASGFGYEIARQFDLKIEETFPCLVGFNLNAQDREKLSGLTGLSFDSTVSCRKHAFRENTLFTHGGLSGPAILSASLYWSPGDVLLIDVCPQTDLRAFLETHRQQKTNRELKNLLSEVLPRRFAEKFCALATPAKTLSGLADRTIDEFCRKAKAWSITPACNFGYGKAEVTRGGISCAELSALTLESKKVKGLYFIGEVVDVTGELGGYNLQWAWASGSAAGKAV
jgi:predicted Rossmann fold flavoprotein